MTTSSSPEPSRPLEPDIHTSRLQVRATILPGILLLVVIVGLITGGYLFFTGQLMLRPAPDSPAGKILAQKELAEKNVDFARRADSARNTVSWASAESKLRTARTMHQRLVAAQTKLTAELKRLADSSDGNRIASRESWVDQFLVIRNRQRLAEDQVTAHLRTIQTLLPVCEQALKEKIVLECDERFLAQVDSVQAALTTAAKEAEDDLSGLELLVRASQTATPVNETLTAATSARKGEQQAQSLAQLTEESSRQRQELEKAARERQLASERELEQSKQAAEQKVREAELAREKAEQAQRVLEANAQSERARRELKQAEDQRERERLRKERIAKFEEALPGMRSLLSPFTSSGKMLYVAGKGWRETEPGPMSLSAIESTGAFKDNFESWYAITALGHQGTNSNDRPLGSFPSTNFNAEKDARRVANFLREYGDLMVEQGMLRP